MMSYNDEATTGPRFPGFLREGRKSAGKTQQEVADHLGVVQSAVSAWEIGRATMPMPVFFRLVQFLELDLAKAMACFVNDAPTDAGPSNVAPIVSATDEPARADGQIPAVAVR